MIQRPLTTSRGENTSAAWGVTHFLLKILEEHSPDYLGFVLDAGMSKREQIYPAYKATREQMPDQHRASLPRIAAIVRNVRIPLLHLPDHHADEGIGTLADEASERRLETASVSRDKAFYQLVG